MTHHLLAISLGPVQDFIAAARRSRDLWFGSWLLSELAKAATAGIVDALGGDDRALEALVFPAPVRREALDPGSSMSVANKLLARVPGDAARARDVAHRGHERMRARLCELQRWAFERTGRGDPHRERHFLVDLATTQIEEAFEYLWVVVPEPDGADGYSTARSQADRYLAARKNTRIWAQPPWSREGLPKSSLDGVRESVLHEDLYERALSGPHRSASLSVEMRRRCYGIHAAERLCGLGLLKRKGVRRPNDEREEHFMSTAHMAALPLLLAIAQESERNKEVAYAWRKLCKAAGPGKEATHAEQDRCAAPLDGVDGGILLEGHLVETLAEHDHPDDSEVTREAVTALRQLLDTVGRGAPIPYYAILVADGDDMGAVIRKRERVEEHRQLSRCLNRFAREAQRVVKDHDGCTIYSGGDDVLALLPLHRALECAHGLAQAFTMCVGEEATLSAGMAIAHFIEPMGYSLKIAREAEQQAKALRTKLKDGAERRKDALAVWVDKRSGETTRVIGHWNELVPRLRNLVDMHRRDEISSKAGHELAELARLGTDLGDIQRSEAVRILGRKRSKAGKEKVPYFLLQDLTRQIGNDAAALGRELVVAEWIARAKHQREGAIQ